MKIKRIQARNFQSYQDFELNLENLSVAGIIGSYKNNPEESNGTGKTTIIDIILYALYGKGRSQSENELIRLGEDEMLVELQFENNNEQIKIIRGRGKKATLNLFVNDKTESEGIRETQDKIIKLIGMEYELFTATVCFQQADADSFCAATPGIRKDYLKKILKLEFYEKCYKEAKTKMDENLEILKGLEYKFESVDERIKDFDIDKKTEDLLLEEKNKDLFENKIKKIETAVLKNIEANSSIDGLFHEITVINADLDDLRKENKQLKEDIYNKEVSLKLCKETKSDITQDLLNKKRIDSNISRDKYKKIEIQLAEVKIEIKNLDELRKLMDNDKCPTCKRDINENFKVKFLKEYELNIKEKEDLSINLSERFDDLDKECVDLVDKIAEMEDEIALVQENEKEVIKLEEQINGLNKEKELVIKKGKLLKENLENTNIKLKEVEKDYVEDTEEQEKELEGYKEEKEECISAISALKLTIKDYKKDKTELNILKKEKNSVNYVYNVYNILKGIFGKNGIIAEIIKQSIDEIEDDSNLILQDIDNHGRSIVFETMKENKTGEIKDSLDIWVETKKGRMKYEQFSGGEKTILNFPIRMALSKLLSKREKTWFGVIFLDEVFALLDKYHMREVIGVINYLKGMFSQIFCISHREIQEAFPNLIRIEKDEKTEISEIKEVI